MEIKQIRQNTKYVDLIITRRDMDKDLLREVLSYQKFHPWARIESLNPLELYNMKVGDSKTNSPTSYIISGPLYPERTEGIDVCFFFNHLGDSFCVTEHRSRVSQDRKRLVAAPISKVGIGKSDLMVLRLKGWRREIKVIGKIDANGFKEV